MVGTASWQILPEIGRVTEPSIEIKSVAVSKKFQRRGVGEALVRLSTTFGSYRPAQLVVDLFAGLLPPIWFS